jgi:multidrug efflux pump subunit AcrA (membrane-fusion protein)
VGEGTDPLVAIRQQELQLKAADLERKSTEFDAKQELEREKEMMDASLAQERLNLQQDALADKTRVAEDRIQTQRDIAALNAQMKGVRQ